MIILVERKLNMECFDMPNHEYYAEDEPYKFLDAILDCFQNNFGDNERKISPTLKYIHERLLNKGIIFTIFILNEALEKLENEKFIKSKDYEELNKVKSKMYELTFEGRLLIHQGGFFLKIQNQNQNQILNRRLSWAVAVGTLLAGIYGIKEICHLFVLIWQWICSCNN